MGFLGLWWDAIMGRGTKKLENHRLIQFRKSFDGACCLCFWGQKTQQCFCWN